MRAGEIAELLAREVDAVAQMLLPNGKKDGAEWRAGDVSGSAGKSLGVRLTGSKAGTWKDFATDEGGDLLDLWAACRGLSLADTIQEAKEYLGIRDPAFHGKKSEVSSLEKPKCHSPKGPVLAWLIEERKIPMEAIKAYAVAEREYEAVFPYLRDGALAFVKYRDCRDKKKMRVEKGGTPILFGWQAIPENAREVVICEGELDALSWWALRHPALSVPNGATGHSWVENEFDHLERFDTIYIAFDADETGRKGAAQLVERLGRERCKVVKMPHGFKDANDLLRANLNPLGLNLLDSAETLDPEELKPASYFAENVYDIFTGKRKDLGGYYLPWVKTRDRFRFRPEEVTILAGENFHGKSKGANHCAIDVMHQGGRVCVASLEYRPEKFLTLLTEQIAGLPRSEVSDGYFWAIQDWLKDKLWVFDAYGTAKAERIIELFTYARKRYQVDFFVVDNLAKCGFSEDDYNGQKHFVDKLTEFAKEHHVHVILVHHLNKAADEGPRNKAAVKGTGAITDMADNVVIWWRNRKKERQIEEGVADGDDIESVLKKPDALMIVEKQKETGDAPKFTLWFHKSTQFTEMHGGRAKQYVRFSKSDTQGMGGFSGAVPGDSGNA